MQKIKLNQIHPHVLQPEGRSQDTTDLQESHRQIGVLRPPIVVPNGPGDFTCLAGWRTITAAKAMGLTEMLCNVREDLEGDADKQAAIFAQSNLHKELTLLEKAGIIESMVGDGRDLRHCARTMGISMTETKHLLNLANAPDEVKELIKRGGRGRDGLSFGTFKVELSSLSSEQMLERLEEAGGFSRKALRRARQKATGIPERILESTDSALQTIQDVRKGLAKTTVFLRTATKESRQEILLALRPIREILVEIVDD